jgi:hypothetical protein
MFVERHADALTATADSQSQTTLATLYGTGQRMGKVGIVATVCRMGAKVAAFIALLREISLSMFFDGKAGMVAGKSDRKWIHDQMISLSGL